MQKGKGQTNMFLVFTFGPLPPQIPSEMHYTLLFTAYTVDTVYTVQTALHCFNCSMYAFYIVELQRYRKELHHNEFFLEYRFF